MEEGISQTKERIPNVMKSAAAVMAADVLLLLGFIFLLLGIAKFLNGFLDIEGVGEGAVGIALLVLGFLILARSRMKFKFAPMPLQRPGVPQKPSREAPSEPYR